MAILINGGTNDILIDGNSVATDAEVAAQIGAIPTVDDASQTVKGIIEIATNAEVQTGTDTVRAITPAGFRSASLGQGQTWQDVTGSRVSGTTYTNSTGKPIQLIVTGTTGNASGVNITVAGLIVSQGYLANGVSGSMIGTAIVPNGATYTATILNTPLLKWYELR